MTGRARIVRILLGVAAALTVVSGAHAAHVIRHASAPDTESLVTQACPPAQGSAPAVVATDRGLVRGANAGATYAYKGIPYAAPPVGELRWRPPADTACWTGERDASEFGPACPQRSDVRWPTDEDCLTLNVWTPATAAGPLPVLFFIHGGANTQGSSAQRGTSGAHTYDGRVIAEQGNVVVVTINYRLGALGFLATEELSAEQGLGMSGNYGILDQVEALRWVQRNIRAFGGDPERVLVFGESAGAVDTCVLLASPLAAGLFSAALMESGGCGQPALAARERSGASFVETAGCTGATDVPACLRALPVEQILNSTSLAENPVVAGGNEWGPAVDGVVLTASPIEVIRAGRHNHVPFIVGANADETGQAAPQMRTEEEYEAAVYRQLGQQLGALALAQYPATAYASPRQAFVAMTTDARFVCPSRTIARAAAGAQQEPVYRYLFSQTAENAATRVLGAFHGLEIPYLFGLELPNYQPSANERTVSAAMIGYWTRFAATGDPNGDGAPAWPPYDPATDPYIELRGEPSAGEGVRTANCDFWERLAAGQSGSP